MEDQEIIVKEDPKLGDVVVVEWDDISTDHGWQENLEDMVPVRCESLGWLLYNGFDRIVLVADIGRNGGVEYNRRIVIPRSVIKKMEKLT